MPGDKEVIEFEHFIGTNVIPKGVAFHPNEKNFVVAAGGNLVTGDLLNAQYQEFFRRHDDLVTCMALSRSGKLVASGQKGENANVYVWDFESTKLLYSFEEHDSGLQCLEFSEDEKFLATVGNNDDHKLMLWDMSNGMIIASSPNLPKETTCIAHGGFVRDIKRRDTNHYIMATGGKEGLVAWDLDPYSGDFEPHPITGDPRGTLVRYISAVTFAEDRDLIYGATSSGDYVIANVRSLRIIQIVPATKMGIMSILSHSDGVIAGCGDNTIKFFDTTGKYLRESRVDGAVQGMSFGPGKQELLALTGNGTVFRVNMSSCQHIIITESHTQGVVAVAYATGRNDRFATASTDGTIRVWDSAEYAVLVVAQARKEQERGVTPLCLAFAEVLYSGWSDGRVLAHSGETGACLWFIDNAHSGGVTALALSHNRRFIVTGGPSGEVRLWELRTRDLVSHLKEHVQRVTSLALMDDDTVVLSASRDRSILRWDLRLERRVFNYTQRMGGVNDIVLSKDERFVLSVGQERRLTYWDMTKPDPVRMFFLDGESDEGKVVAVSHSGKLIATGGSAGMVRVWSYDTSELLHAGSGHSGSISSIVFSPDDKQIISVADDGSIIMWCVFVAEGGVEGRGVPISHTQPMSQSQHSWGMKASIHT